MKRFLIMLNLSCFPIWTQSLSAPHFADPPKVVTYYQLTHPPRGPVKKLLIRAAQKMHKKDFDGAISLLRSALALDRASWEGHINLGAAYFWEGDRKSAETEFESAVALDPANPLSYADLAVCQLRAGRDESAVQLAKRALHLDPENRLASTILAVEGKTGK